MLTGIVFLARDLAVISALVDRAVTRQHSRGQRVRVTGSITALVDELAPISAEPLRTLAP